MVVGAHAVFAFGAPRQSGDLDVVIHVPSSERERVRTILERHGLRDLDWREDPLWGRRWLGIDKSALPVEIFLTGGSPVAEREYERRRPVQVGGHRIWFISPEDLVLRKLVNCRLRKARDFEDAVSVLRVQGETLDFGYLRAHCGVYGVCGLLDQALQEADRQGRAERPA